MRIAHFNIMEGAHGGGAENVMLQLAIGQQARGHHVEFWTHNLPVYHQRAKEAGLTALNIVKHRKIQQLPFFILYLKTLMKERQIDILHSHLFSTILRAGVASFRSFPHVVTLHDSASITRRPYTASLFKMFACGGTYYVAVSEEIEQVLLERNFPKTKLEIILNGVDVNAIQNTPSDRNVLSKYGVKENDVVISMVAVLREVKRHDFFIECIKRIPQRLPYKVLIVGDGPERENVEQLIKQYGLESKVVITGFTDEVYPILRASDIFTLTSEAEGLPCALQEAMAAELPSVVTDVGGNGQVVRNGNEGYIIPFGDAEEIASAYTKLIKDESLRKSMGEQSFQTISKGFSLDHTLDQYEDIYEKAIYQYS